MKWTEEEVDILKENYSKMMAEDIIKKWMPYRTKRSIWLKVYRLGLQTYGRQYYCNDLFFHIPNKMNSYYAGLLAADGYIVKRDKDGLIKNKLGISLCKLDADHLEKMRKCMNSNYPFYDKLNQRLFLIQGYQKIIDDLENIFSITERKSLTLQPPKIYTENDIRAFIRGYFDGDGCLSYYKPKNRWVVTFGSASYNILKWIYNQVNIFLSNIKCHISSTSINRKNTVYYLNFCGSVQVYKFLNWLYADSEDLTRLDRKYDLFLKFCKQYIERQNKLTSKYIGVNHRYNKWTSTIGYNYKNYHIGTFLTEKEAAVAYNAKARELGLFDRCYEVN